MKYSIHKAILTFDSDYFCAAYNGKWAEGESRVILEDVEPNVFDIFIHWLYSQQLPTTWPEFLELSGAEVEDVEIRGRSLAVKVYVFADRFIALRFKVAIYELFTKLTAGYAMNYSNVIYAFANLESTDPLLKYMVVSQSQFWSPEQDEPHKSNEVGLRTEIPNEFLVRVMVKMHGLKRSRKS